MRRSLYLAGIVVLLATAAAWPASPQAATTPPTPVGVTAIALDGQVGVAWQPVEGATGYQVYRGGSATTINQLVSPAGLTGTEFADATAINGQTYFYAVRAVAEGEQSTPSGAAKARPRARSCTSSNPIVAENCFPGTTDWKSTDPHLSYPGGFDAFASASSVDAGDSVDLRVYANPDTPYHVEIYRTGSYGGLQGRLVGEIPGLIATNQPVCASEPTTTGILDCAAWATSLTISTTSAWTTGVYLLKLVRDDNGQYNEVLLVVRDDDSTSDIVYKLPTATYQAYNNYGGKALYDSLSDTPNTVSTKTRAVSVSFDRPYSQPGVEFRNDWYTHTDVMTVSWLERQGYDVSYIADEDMHVDGARISQHKVMLSGNHDEYWSQEMFDAALAARDAGTSLLFIGANAVYWRIRFEPSPVSGVPNRVVTTYKTIASGPADPVSSTSTFRDPAGPNQPENALIGQMYAGDNSTTSFPLRVSAAEGRHRVWRYTPLTELDPGQTASIGTKIVGWEWDNRVDNGAEPAGIENVASSPVSGGLIQANGAFQAQGNTTATATIYRAASGALVFSTGTNNWARGLALNVRGEGEPDDRIQQATVNVLRDMGAAPATLAGGLQVDATGPPQVTATSPAAGSTTAVPTHPVTVTLDRELDPGSIDASDFTLTAPGGVPVAAAVSLGDGGKTLVLDPDDLLEPFTSYTARLGTGVISWLGEAPAAPYEWSFSTGTGTPPVVTSRGPLAGATGVPTDVAVHARFDRRLDPTTVTSGNFTLRPTAGGSPVPATLSYDAPTRTARLVPSQRLAESTQYTAQLTTAIHADDGTAMSAADSWSFTTGVNLQVTSRTPAPLSSGNSPAATVRAVLSRAADPATITPATFTLTDSGGLPVAASVSYDPITRTATLRPSAPLTLLTTYTATLTGAVHAADGAPLDASTWTFTTAAVPPPAPTITTTLPAAGATGVPNDTPVRATFDLALDPSTVTPTTFALATSGGAAVPATVTYDALARRATLTPLAPLATGAEYTATLSTEVRSTTGAPMSAATNWSFTTAECPCTLLGSSEPDWRLLPVRDNRPAPGPWTYELGTKIQVTQTTELTALRFFKEAGETGTHVGRVWNASGTQLTSVTYTGESASGWQRQALPAPLTLQPGQVYTLSVGVNSMYAKAQNGLRLEIVSGPLRSIADNLNGVFANSAGQFPTNSWGASNYFVDGVVRLPGKPLRIPQVTTRTPSAGATGVGVASHVTAGFNVPLTASTVTPGSFTLRDEADQPVAATVAYDAGDQTVKLTPSTTLEPGTAYTATLTTAIRSDDNTPMAAPVSWTFSTVPAGPPAVLEMSPASAATDVTGMAHVTARFDQGMDASTLTAANVRLSGPGSTPVPASVSYSAPARTVTLVPSSPLAASTTYTVELTTAVRSSRGIALAAPISWTFTTSPCPCRLFGTGNPQPDYTGVSTRNGRDPAGGPYTLELGLKVRVTQPSELTGIRYYRDADETGTHVGRVWSASGTQLASVTFTGETASGWQEQSLSTPLALVPGQVYVVSVGMNTAFSMTAWALTSEVMAGPLRSVADGQNGVYGDSAGSFPTNSWGSSNYFVDTVVR